MLEKNAIELRHMSKQFKIEYDKAHSLKEMFVFWKKSPVEYHKVLEDISLDIEKGETVALIGTNGSGKSTLLKLMTKIIYPTSGTISTDGKLTSLLELGAGFHPDFTGRENIYFNASIFGLTRSDIDKRIDDIIEFSELGEFIDNPIRTYSSGMYMRLAFSVAINVDAEILLIDEILAVGDQHFQEKCFRKLEELKHSDKTIVIVSHSLDVVKKLCDRAVWIYKGHIKMDDRPDRVIENYLNQVALDHMEERKKALNEGTHVGRGMVYIDEPKDYQVFSKNLKSVYCHGWMLSDDPHAILQITVDGKEIKPSLITRYRRVDVYNAFREDFAGLVDIDQLGWKLDLPLEGLSLGEHEFKVASLTQKQDIMADTKIRFSIE